VRFGRRGDPTQDWVQCCAVLWSKLDVRVFLTENYLRSERTGQRTTYHILKGTVTCMSDYRWGFGLEIGFIGHFNTRLVTTINYSAIADLHTLQITTAHAKSFQSAVSSPVIP
jgi:hypothetical protein